MSVDDSSDSCQAEATRPRGAGLPTSRLSHSFASAFIHAQACALWRTDLLLVIRFMFMCTPIWAGQQLASTHVFVRPLCYRAAYEKENMWQHHAAAAAHQAGRGHLGLV